MGVADPVPGQIPGQDGALDAEHFHADDSLGHGDHTGLHNAAFVDTVHAVSIQIEVEDLAFTHHRLPAAGDHAAGLGVNAPHHKVDVGAQHVAQDLVLAQHQVGVVLARRAAAQVDHHFLDGNDDAETLVVHHGHRLTVVQLLDAAQLARQNTAGAIGVMNLMPDDILTVFRRLYILTAANGQDRGLTARLHIPPASGRPGSGGFRHLLLHRGGIILQNGFTLCSSILGQGLIHRKRLSVCLRNRGLRLSSGIRYLLLAGGALGLCGRRFFNGLGIRLRGSGIVTCAVFLCGEISVAVSCCLIVLLEVCVLVRSSLGGVLVAAHSIIAEHFGFRKLRQITGGIIGRGRAVGLIHSGQQSVQVLAVNRGRIRSSRILGGNGGILQCGGLRNRGLLFLKFFFLGCHISKTSLIWCITKGSNPCRLKQCPPGVWLQVFSRQQ